MVDKESQKVTIDDKEYDPDKLSDSAKGQIVNLQVVDQEIASLQQKLAIAQGTVFGGFRAKEKT